MSTAPTFAGFRRVSLADQAALALRDGVRRRVWGQFLPGEYELARQLGISRPSVRAALARLAEDGLIEISKGRRTRIIRTGRTRPSGATPTVCIIAASQGLGLPQWNDHPVLLEMRAELAAQGIGWEEVGEASLGGKNPEHRLKELVTGRQRVCWVMLSVSMPVQRWFEKAGVPALVLGSCYPGIELPSVDTNYRAAGWHAAGCLSRHGHRDVVVVLPHRPMPGDLACRDGVSDYLKQMDAGISITDLAAGPSAAGLEPVLDRLLARQPRPTAILTMRPQYTLTVLIRLLQVGLRIPEDVSLISRDTHSLLELAIPDLTCYRTAFAKQARRAVRVAQSLLAGHLVPPRPNLIIPTFVTGSTLAPRPGALMHPGPMGQPS